MRAPIFLLLLVATNASISPLFKGALLLSMKDEQGSEIQVSERQARSVRQLLGL